MMTPLWFAGAFLGAAAGSLFRDDPVTAVCIFAAGVALIIGALN